MSELDLELKALGRRLLWTMGFSTRVDVQMRSYVPVRSRGGRNSTGFESYTDLDVLGIAFSPGFQTQRVVIDCKTTKAGSTERMFWLRGLADFFEADMAYMLRSKAVTDSARQLASRLKLGALLPVDVEEMEKLHRVPFDFRMGPLAQLFDPALIAKQLENSRQIDSRLQPLAEYVEFDYWVYDPYRNLTQMVAHLADVRSLLNPSNPRHLGILFDCIWLYLATCAKAIEYVRVTHISDVDQNLQAYLFGGQVALREKQHLATQMRGLVGNDPSVGSVLPEWYPGLLELIGRLIRNPSLFAAAMRYAEWLSFSLTIENPASIHTAFGKFSQPTAAKLVADVAGFLVSAAGLKPSFRQAARAVAIDDFLIEPPEQFPGQLSLGDVND
ncbi:hypothetical protein OG747_52485 (plasmid) [Streptomyces sp. NBC_01384]|uniref:hypothetical protein n=1 Tax=Streptomyces sp. NBC_01384 TaxID=2903847 RepID=UPI002F91133A